MNLKDLNYGGMHRISKVLVKEIAIMYPAHLIQQPLLYEELGMGRGCRV
jgi:hypothetical protein